MKNSNNISIIVADNPLPKRILLYILVIISCVLAKMGLQVEFKNKTSAIFIASLNVAVGESNNTDVYRSRQ